MNTPGLHVLPSNITDYLLDVADYLDQYATRKSTPQRLSQYLAVMLHKSAEEVLAKAKQMYIQGLSQS